MSPPCDPHSPSWPLYKLKSSPQNVWTFAPTQQEHLYKVKQPSMNLTWAHVITWYHMITSQRWSFMVSCTEIMIWEHYFGHHEFDPQEWLATFLEIPGSLAFQRTPGPKYIPLFLPLSLCWLWSCLIHFSRLLCKPTASHYMIYIYICIYIYTRTRTCNILRVNAKPSGIGRKSRKPRVSTKNRGFYRWTSYFSHTQPVITHTFTGININFGFWLKTPVILPNSRIFAVGLLKVW